MRAATDCFLSVIKFGIEGKLLTELVVRSLCVFRFVADRNACGRHLSNWLC